MGVVHFIGAVLSSEKAPDVVVQELLCAALCRGLDTSKD